jgi:hypothetical protein
MSDASDRTRRTGGVLPRLEPAGPGRERVRAPPLCGTTEGVYPEVRAYADPLEGLTAQFTELRGLIRIVPPLIDVDRERRWEEIARRPSDGEDGDIVDIYGAEAGPEEGYGFADFARTIRVATVVTAWAVFEDYLVHELRRRLVDEGDAPTWHRRFKDIVKRYRESAGLDLKQWPSWEQVRHAQALRNALVHNQGVYTPGYLNTELAHRPTEDELLGFTPPADDAGLINRELIPLSFEQADGVIAQLLAFANEVREALDKPEPDDQVDPLLA